MTVQWSDADDVNEIAESGEVVGISGVDREAVGAVAAMSRSATRRRSERPVSATAATICP